MERGAYPTLSAAVSGELARARASRERDRALLEAEVRRRLVVPLDEWVPVGDVDNLTRGALSGSTRSNGRSGGRVGAIPVRIVPHPLLERDIVGIAEHVHAVSGDAAAARRRVAEVRDLIAAFVEEPGLGAKPGGPPNGWCVWHGGGPGRALPRARRLRGTRLGGTGRQTVGTGRGGRRTVVSAALNGLDCSVKWLTQIEGQLSSYESSSRQCNSHLVCFLGRPPFAPFALAAAALAGVELRPPWAPSCAAIHFRDPKAPARSPGT